MTEAKKWYEGGNVRVDEGKTDAEKDAVKKNKLHEGGGQGKKLGSGREECRGKNWARQNRGSMLITAECMEYF